MWPVTAAHTREVGAKPKMRQKRPGLNPRESGDYDQRAGWQDDRVLDRIPKIVRGM